VGVYFFIYKGDVERGENNNGREEEGVLLFQDDFSLFSEMKSLAMQD